MSQSKSWNVGAFCLLFGLLSLLAPTPAAYAEEIAGTIAAYWDAGLTEILTTAAPGDTLTAHIVLETSVTGDNLELVFFELSGGFWADVLDVTSDLGDVTSDFAQTYIVQIPDGTPPAPRLEVATARILVPGTLPGAISTGTCFFSVDGQTQLARAVYRYTEQLAWFNTGAALGTANPASLDFPTTGLGVMRNASTLVSNTGRAPLFLDYSELAACGDFAPPSDPDRVADVIGLSEAMVVPLGFVPTAAGERTCAVSLAPGVDLELHGIGREPIHQLTVADTAAFAWPVNPGQQATRTVYVQNTGDFSEDLTVTFADACPGFSLNPESPTVLAPLGVTFLYFWFTPPEPGPAACTVDIGGGLATVVLTAEGTDLGSGLAFAPEVVDFEGVVPGATATMPLVITNVSYETVVLTPGLNDVAGVFNLATRATDTTLDPGESIEFVARFQPSVTGPYAGAVLLGDGLPTVPLVGVCAEVVRSVAVSPAVPTLRYANVGQIATGTAVVTNTGLTTLTLEPRCYDSHLVSLSPTAPQTLAIGASLTIQISARTYEYGRFVIPVELNQERDLGFDVVLEPEYDFGPDENRLGLYFDADLSIDHLVAPRAPQLVRAYLALLNPTDPAGVIGWECRLTPSAGAVAGPITLAGAAIDIDGDPYTFVVGLADPPLPSSAATLLAEIDYLVFDMTQDLVSIRAEATATPSLPGLMAWVPASARETLVPMVPVTGMPELAWIELLDQVALAAPAPVSAVDGRTVVLTWPDQSAGSDGYHVYRRGGDDLAETRLTTAPVRGSAGVVRFVDETVDATAGAGASGVLHYRYVLVAGGRDVATSPETDVQMAVLPAFRTRLLGNAPNPFNPETEIRFEVARRTAVTVRLYDVTGRLVRELVNDVLEAGPATVRWDGRDGRGAAVASGVYYVRLETSAAVAHLKVMLLK